MRNECLPLRWSRGFICRATKVFLAICVPTFLVYAFRDNINGLNSELRGPWELSLACFIFSYWIFSCVSTMYMYGVLADVLEHSRLHVLRATLLLDPFLLSFLSCLYSFIFHAAYCKPLDALWPPSRMQPFRQGQEDYACPGQGPHQDVRTSIHRPT